MLYNTHIHAYILLYDIISHVVLIMFSYADIYKLFTLMQHLDSQLYCYDDYYHHYYVMDVCLGWHRPVRYTNLLSFSWFGVDELLFYHVFASSASIGVSIYDIRGAKLRVSN